MQRRISTTMVRYPWLVCLADDGTVAGYTYAGAHSERAAYQWSADVSVYNHEKYRRVGVGSALYSAMLAILELQGIRRVCAGIALPNEASVGLHEAMGFEFLGTYRDIGYKFGAWH